MKLITGKYRNRKLVGDNILGTRPTMNKIKESLIATVYKYIEGATILDLFAGSGSMAFEFISNDAKYAYLVDNNIKCIKAIYQNIDNLNIKNIKVLKKDYFEALEYFNKLGIKFDIIYIDPPYDKHLISGAIKRIQKYDLLNNNGLIICEYLKEEIDTNLNLIINKTYGDKKVSIYQKEKATN